MSSLCSRASRFMLSIGVAASTFACGGMNPPATMPTPVPSGDYPRIAGQWVGTLQSSNLASQPMTMDVVQTSDCVDGGWKTGEWNGAISGYAVPSGFAGVITFQRTDNGARCNASANVSGEVTVDSLRWTTGDLVGECSVGSLPQAVVIAMRRQ